MNKRVIIVAAIAAALGTIGWFLFTNEKKAVAPVNETSGVEAEKTNTDTQTPSDSSDQNQPGSVMYSNSGFSPGELTVKVGAVVEFKNGSSKQMRIVANPALGGLDSKQAFGTGEIFKFTFTKAGTYTYENQINPTDTGKIIVEP